VAPEQRSGGRDPIPLGNGVLTNGDGGNGM